MQEKQLLDFGPITDVDGYLFDLGPIATLEDQLFDFGPLARLDGHLFSLGRLVLTRGAIEALCEAEQGPAEFLRRHVAGDWGDMSKGDKQRNQFSIDKDLRIFSAYHTNKKTKIWVITEADRHATTILLPDEY